MTLIESISNFVDKHPIWSILILIVLIITGIILIVAAIAAIWLIVSLIIKRKNDKEEEEFMEEEELVKEKEEELVEEKEEFVEEIPDIKETSTRYRKILIEYTKKDVTSTPHVNLKHIIDIKYDLLMDNYVHKKDYLKILKEKTIVQPNIDNIMNYLSNIVYKYGFDKVTIMNDDNINRILEKNELDSYSKLDIVNNIVATIRQKN